MCAVKDKLSVQQCGLLLGLSWSGRVMLISSPNYLFKNNKTTQRGVRTYWNNGSALVVCREDQLYLRFNWIPLVRKLLCRWLKVGFRSLMGQSMFWCYDRSASHATSCKFLLRILFVNTITSQCLSLVDKGGSIITFQVTKTSAGVFAFQPNRQCIWTGTAESIQGETASAHAL